MPDTDAVPETFHRAALPTTAPPVGVDWVRLCHRAHADPLGCAPAKGRFGDGSFAVVSLAQDRATALAEAVIRDRGAGSVHPVILSEAELAQLYAARIVFREAPALLDLWTRVPTSLGIPTDVVRAQRTRPAWARAIYDNATAVDGVLYPSRFTGARNIALYDRAVHKAAVLTWTPVLDWPDLDLILDAHNAALADDP